VVGSEPGAGRTAPPFPQLAKKVRLNEFLIGFWLRNPNPPCHVVGSEPGAGRTAPPFPQLAKKVRLNEFLIGFWLRNPTPPMHSFQLPQPMVSDITTYLRSLKK
jgi:hypothetical protein